MVHETPWHVQLLEAIEQDYLRMCNVAGFYRPRAEIVNAHYGSVCHIEADTPAAAHALATRIADAVNAYEGDQR